MTDEKHLVYDEEEAVKYIRNFIPQDVKERFTDDDINYIIDIVYEYYDSKGLLDESTDEETVIDIDEDELVSFVLKATKKEKVNNFTSDEISFIIQGELAYCDSIGIFE